MERIPVCKICGNRLSFNGFAGMGSSHSNWYICDTDGCSRKGKDILITDDDLRCDSKMRI